MNRTEEIIVGACVGVGGGILLSLGLFFLLRCFLLNSRGNKKKTKDEEQIASEMPMRMNDVLAVMDSSGSLESISQLPGIIQRKIPPQVRAAQSNALASASGIPRYSYKDIKESTHNFTTTVGKGSFGSVYKAEMPDGAVVAVKVLAANSRQGDKEFQTEVLLLSKLHHRNLVNLIGFCVEKGQYMLVYEFMSNGSLASHLYGVQSLTWEERINIALDISRGIQYLHEGTVPPVIHRDLKSANILLDSSLTAKVFPDCILSYRFNRDGMQVLVKWKNLPNYEATWEDITAIQCQFPSFPIGDQLVFSKGSNDKHLLRTYNSKRRRADSSTRAD
ncbi:protein kinase superfamily protein isoform X2 [Wolffia australiana]